jgi:hypothetical protein
VCLQLVECIGDLKDEDMGEAVVLYIISMGWCDQVKLDVE